MTMIRHWKPFRSPGCLGYGYTVCVRTALVEGARTCMCHTRAQQYRGGSRTAYRTFCTLFVGAAVDNMAPVVLDSVSAWADG